MVEPTDSDPTGVPPPGERGDEPADLAGDGLPGTAEGRQSIAAQVPRIGIWSWSFVGFVVAAGMVVAGLSTVSEIVLPMTFAAVLAVLFRPLVFVLERRGLRPSLAAGLVVVGLILLMVGVVVLTVRGVADQADQLADTADAALEEAAKLTDALGVDEQTLDDARTALGDAAPMIASGVVSGVVAGLGTAVAVASGVILGTLIMYYLLKDGARLRRSLVEAVAPTAQADVDGFIGEACRTLRSYGKGRTILSAIVSVVVGLSAAILGLPLVLTIVVVNFIGGYIPYIGAFLGGGLAVIVALGDGGLSEAVVMLVIVLAANLVLENFVEPKVMGSSLDVHPLVVLVVTALGGLLGGIVGLILAVPAYVIAGDAIRRLRARGVVERMAERAPPRVRRVLD